MAKDETTTIPFISGITKEAEPSTLKNHLIFYHTIPISVKI
jgi:hypothetical protein